MQEKNEGMQMALLSKTGRISDEANYLKYLAKQKKKQACLFVINFVHSCVKYVEIGEINKLQKL